MCTLKFTVHVNKEERNSISGQIGSSCGKAAGGERLHPFLCVLWVKCSALVFVFAPTECERPAFLFYK